MQRSIKLSTKLSFIAVIISVSLCIITVYIFNNALYNTLYGEKYTTTVHALQNTIQTLTQQYTAQLATNNTVHNLLKQLRNYSLLLQTHVPSYTQQQQLLDNNIALTFFTPQNKTIAQYGNTTIPIQVFSHTTKKDSLIFSFLPGERLLLQTIIPLQQKNYVVARTIVPLKLLGTSYTQFLTENSHLPLSFPLDIQTILHIPNTPLFMQNLQPAYATLIRQYTNTKNPKEHRFFSLDTKKQRMLVLTYTPQLNLYSVATVSTTALSNTLGTFRTFALLFIVCFTLLAVAVLYSCMYKALQPFEKILHFFHNFIQKPHECTPLDNIKLRETLLHGVHTPEIIRMTDILLQLMENHAIQQNKIQSLTAMQENFLQEYALAKTTQNAFNAHLTKYHTNPELIFRTCCIQEHTLNTSFYDSYYVDTDTLLIAIGESNTRSIASSIALSYIQGMLRNITPEDNLASKAEECNTIVKEHTIKGFCIDLFIGLFNIQTGTLYYINAGFDTPLLLHNGSVQENIFETLQPIGEWDGLYINPKPIQLQEGDTLLFHTKGLFQLHNIENTYYTATQLKTFLAEHTIDTADAIATELKHNLYMFTAGTSSLKEVLCLCFQYKPNILREKQLYGTMVGADQHAIQLQEGSIYTYKAPLRVF